MEVHEVGDPVHRFGAAALGAAGDGAGADRLEAGEGADDVAECVGVEGQVGVSEVGCGFIEGPGRLIRAAAWYMRSQRGVTSPVISAPR